MEQLPPKPQRSGAPQARRSVGLWRVILVWLLLATTASQAATNIVLATDSLQQKIDEAAPGDVLVLQGGAYSGATNISKPLSFVRSGTNDVQWLAALSIQTTGSVTLVQMSFSAAVMVAGGTDLLLQDSLLNSTLNVNGGKTTIRHSNVSGRIDLTSGDFIGLKMNNGGGIYAVATVGTGKQFVLAQSTCSTINITGYRVWLAYNSFDQSYNSSSSVVAIGNYANPAMTSGSGWKIALSVSGGDLLAYNNKFDIYSSTGGSDSHWRYVAGIKVDGCKCQILNNTIRGYASGWDTGDKHCYSYGVVVGGSSVPVTIKNNIIQVQGAGYNFEAYGILGSSSAVEISYSCLYTTTGAAPGGNPYQCLNANPVLNGDLSLSLNSPCINTGSPEAFYNDRDGTRNDMGFTGGPLYQANGMTTDKPLLFWLMPVQQQVWKNAQAILNVDAAAAAGH